MQRNLLLRKKHALPLVKPTQKVLRPTQKALPAILQIAIPQNVVLLLNVIQRNVIQQSAKWKKEVRYLLNSYQLNSYQS